PVPRVSPGRSPRWGERPSWVAETPPRPSGRWAWTKPRSPTSAPVVVPRSSFSRARPCLVWPCSTTTATVREPPHEQPHATDGGQLEDEPEPSRGHRTGAEDRLLPGPGRLRRRRGGGAATVHGSTLGADAGRRRQAGDSLRRAGRLFARSGRTHR